MKKFAPFLSTTLALSLLAGCAGNTVVYSDCSCSGETGTVTPTEAVTADGAVRTGLAILTDIKTGDGEAEYDVTLAAVLVDESGVILDCVIDSVGVAVQFDETGFLTADGEILTKTELGDSYGMVTFGGAAAEWYQQAEALAEFAQGKTLEEFKSRALNDRGYAEDADLAASATIRLDGYVAAVEAAVENAKPLGARQGDRLKLATLNSLSGGSLVCDAAAVSMDGDMITSCSLDSLQAEIALENGRASAANTRTKKELGFDYGMTAWGGASFEWFQQAENFAAYITGKTPEEVAGIAVTQAGTPAEADLAASVTIAIGGFRELIAKTAGQSR